MTGEDGEPTLADVQRQFPGWEAWRGVSGLFYARRAGRPCPHKADVQGEDPLDLMDQIKRAKDQEDMEGQRGQRHKNED
jgi:hypothetical protein